MAVIGFSFSKFDCVRGLASPGQIEISHNVKVDSVGVTNLNVGAGKSDVLKIDFTFTVKYGESLGHIVLSGDVVYSDTPEIISETLKLWNSDKKLTEMVNNEVSKFIYTKGIVKALDLSDSLNLPAPIPVVPSGMFGAKK